MVNCILCVFDYNKKWEKEEVISHAGSDFLFLLLWHDGRWQERDPVTLTILWVLWSPSEELPTYWLWLTGYGPFPAHGTPVSSPFLHRASVIPFPAMFES